MTQLRIYDGSTNHIRDHMIEIIEQRSVPRNLTEVRTLGMAEIPSYETVDMEYMIVIDHDGNPKISFERDPEGDPADEWRRGISSFSILKMIRIPEDEIDPAPFIDAVARQIADEENALFANLIRAIPPRSPFQEGSSIRPSPPSRLMDEFVMFLRNTLQIVPSLDHSFIVFDDICMALIRRRNS